MDVPRRLPPSQAQRIKNLANQLGSRRGGTAWGSQPNNGTATPTSGGAGGTVSTDAVPAGTDGFTVDDSESVFGSLFNAYVPPDAVGTNAIVFAAKIDGDAYARVLFCADSIGGIYFGDGTIPATDGINLYLSDNGTLAITADVEIINRSLDVGKNITFDAGNLGDPINEHTAPRALGVRSYTTAQRLAQIVVAAGVTDSYQVFDTDLGKPVWFNPASGVWVDASGTAV